MTFLLTKCFKYCVNLSVPVKYLSVPVKYLSVAVNQTKLQCLDKSPIYLQLNNTWTAEFEDKALNLFKDMTVHENFISENDELDFMQEIEPYMKRLRYEFDHWDDAIHGYRETERLQWNVKNTATINRLREIAFPKSVAQLKHVHILDLAPKGYIKPHIDAVRFCGNTIAGISLLSDCVMRLVDDKHKSLSADIFLRRRSLYIMKDTARYDYTHEILADDVSMFKNNKVPRSRRVSIICRNEPS